MNKWVANLKWSMLLAVMATPALAHHSFAGYDMTKTLSAQATIKEFRWGAPHSAVVLVIEGPDGKPQEMTVASAAPAMFIKQGFKPKDFRAGVKLAIEWHPVRSGARGGIISAMTLPDGRTFVEKEFSAPAPTTGAETAP